MIDNYPYVNIHTHQLIEGELTIQTIGVHPYDAQLSSGLTLQEIKHEVEAIGEIGLDYSITTDKQVQANIFRQQLSIAEKLSLPVVIHSVRAFDATLKVLEDYNLPSVIFHGFIGSKEQVARAIKRGYYLSFGFRCFASPKTLEALRLSPLESIFLETDDHDISIEEIYHRAAGNREESLEQIKEQLYKNYIKLFANK